MREKSLLRDWFRVAAHGIAGLSAFVFASSELVFSQSALADGTPVCDRHCVYVAIVEARTSTFTPTIAITGEIQPKFQSNIAFRVSGKMISRLVEIGDHVTADQILAKLDPKEQQANLDNARAAMASARALLTQAKLSFDRQEALFKNGFATRPNYDQARQQLATQQASVESMQAAQATAQEQFAYTDLKAGVSGIVTARNAETGQIVQAGQSVFTIAQDGPRDAVFDVYEALVSGPPPSDQVRVSLQSDPSVWTMGTVREISPTVATASGTVRVKVGLVSVPAGMSLGAAVVGSGDFKPRRAIALPRGALFRWEDAPAVWMLDPATNRVTPRVVTIDRYDGDRIVLSGGVSEGDRVVTAGMQFLHPGQIVAIAKTEPVP